ncbi:MAG: MscS mechanosensitive ion channel [Henriciella sp.]|jgi:small-conductance mechanosensitive channel|uniref:mechanosensitive ion channel family protein n=1 Tax=Henriciella sp. TaxID=1968823 RepID=UPI000C1065C0|nr:mechanosensitive ion channel family protein [Henriciella sp.]MAN74865.1 MscS mechanosensitive ion channel [Henriciella sp.]MBF33939.1 MscS mechanosensitive ion channel [Hyphomonadaceae bacterium]PHR80146.1 MAG: MscS mechanosensitive ion channel [Henriciella sp.]|tara:strand:+ start:20635 stop:22047 length:1413 start_codon:yes stop_codon:yes gene_type:complete
MISLVRTLSLALAALAILAATPVAAPLAHAQTSEQEAPAPAEPIAVESSNDGAIEARINAIFDEISALSGVEASVSEGVVSLSGMVANQTDIDRAVSIASRFQGVVTVEQSIERDLSVDRSISPTIANLENSLRRGWEALPLVGLAVAVFLVIFILGQLLASWSALWRRLTPNPFLAEIVAQAVRFIALVVGLVTALNLIGATALMGAILGGAGVIGLAIGFAVRDTVENYIASIMLSLRQPFRANDHVLVDSHEGRVVRLTSRATILMTLDGNHLRVPNSTVFKAVILNYTRNPERRFDFELGVDAEDDPVAAMATGIAAMASLDFVLNDPKPDAIITAVGDSNIVISFMGWVDQSHTDFGKARSLAIRAAKDALETEGFTLPEPIYRLRFDGAPVAIKPGTVVTVTEGETPSQTAPPPKPKAAAPAEARTAEADVLNTRPDDHIAEKVKEERAQTGEKDLLDSGRPVE